MGYAAKRDRWNGYDPDQYKQDVIQHWSMVDEVKQTHKEALRDQKKRKREEKALNK